MDREKLKQLEQELSLKTQAFEQSIYKLKNEISKLKSTCEHNRFIYDHGSNTGNYDPTCDCHWIDIECLDCGMKSSFYDDSDQYSYWQSRQYDKDIELGLSKDEYKIAKNKGLI